MNERQMRYTPASPETLDGLVWELLGAVDPDYPAGVPLRPATVPRDGLALLAWLEGRDEVSSIILCRIEGWWRARVSGLGSEPYYGLSKSLLMAVAVAAARFCSAVLGERRQEVTG